MAGGVDTMRREGTSEFENTVRELARIAGQVDELWQRYSQVCTGYSYGATYGRDWFGVWSAPVALVNQDLPECRLLSGDILEKAATIREGMKAAEERARRSHVYPGVRRDIRRKYSMDWTGWEKSRKSRSHS